MALSPASLAPPTLQPQSLKPVAGARCSFPPGEILVVESCRFTAVPQSNRDSHQTVVGIPQRTLPGTPSLAFETWSRHTKFH